MARCNESTCSCLIQAGEGVVIRGSGTATNPYIVESTVSLAGSLIVNDTDTVDLAIWGSGSIGDPYRLTADARMSMRQLTDVSDPQGGPAVGDVPIWVGAGSEGHFEFQPPPASPPGAVNVDLGIRGTGAVAAPIKVALVDEAIGSDTGLQVYVDTSGNLRATPPEATAVQWASILGRPNTFPPSAHTHTMSQITDYTFPTWAQVTGKPTVFAPSAHKHAMSDITNYVFPTWAQVTGKPTTFTPSAHDINSATHTGILSVANGGTGSTTAANARAALGAQVAGSYAASSHTHTISQITNITSASVAYASNAGKVGGRAIFVQSGSPSGMLTGDLWFY